MTALVSALGIAQIASRGTLFHAIGVVGPALQRDLGVSRLSVFGASTAGSPGFTGSSAGSPASSR